MIRSGPAEAEAASPLHLAPRRADLTSQIDRWGTRIRRILLAGHALPGLFGFVAMLLLWSDGGVRPVDLGMWALVAVWTQFLLIGGWSRVGDTGELTRWIYADAVIMAALQFVGTPAREITNYVSIDGALFAAMFISVQVSLTQIAVVYGAFAAGLALDDLGIKIASPSIGWITPVLITLIGVGALRYLGLALTRLQATADAYDRTVERQRVLRAQEAASRALAQTCAALDDLARAPIADLARLAQEYSAATRRDPLPAQEASAWLIRAADTAMSDLVDLQASLWSINTDRDLYSTLDEAISECSVLHLKGILVERDYALHAAAPALPPELTRCVRGVVREALANAAIHGAPPISVGVRILARDCAQVVVTDSGPGFAPDAIARGQGLTAIERAAAQSNLRVAFVRGTGQQHVTLDVPVGGVH